ncbi:MAG: peptidylprolyl isomerase [Thaumarchaeota archaeon]|nr:peptidylprolyl isomerase [Nitrososphaerota archaeon]
MSQRKRRGKKKSSNRNTYIAIAAVVLVIVAAGGYYAYASSQPKSPNTSSSLTTSSTLTTTPTGSGPYAVISTTQGTIEVELFPQAAPKTVANFVSLANSGFYDNLVWHRIVAGFAIQIGDPTSRNGGGNESLWGNTGSTQTVPLETNTTLVNEGYVNNAGYLGMARTSDPNSGSSQFFINLASNTSLNGQYTVFGKVISGMSVVDAIGALPVNPACQSSGGTSCQPLDPTNAEILSITIQSSP